MKKIVIGNLKMNLLSSLERERYLEMFKKEIRGKKLKNSEIVLCPPFVHLEAFVRNLKSKTVAVGAQNIFSQPKGPYTGEVSPPMVKNLGGDYVVLGHSERRKHFLEDNQEINLKVMAALKSGLRPVICVGEKLDEKMSGDDVIMRQLQECLSEVSRAKIENVVICYEPVWAISSNNPDHLPSTNEIMEARLLIRKFLVGKYGLKIAEKVRIIYGGSVSAANTKKTCVDSSMEGALVGKESLAPHEFVKIAEIIDNS